MKMAAAAVVLAAGLASSPAVPADDQDAIDYRNHIMQTLEEQLAAIDLILDRKAPSDNLAVHARVLAVTALQAKQAFTPKVPGGKSRLEVWSNWPDFARRLDALVAATDGLAKVAKTGGAVALGPKLKSTLDCEGCHAMYMTQPPRAASAR